MSTLIKEDDEFLYLERYLHDESDEFSRWEMDANHEHKYPEYIQEAENYAFSEIKAKYRIRKSDGQVFYDSFE